MLVDCFTFYNEFKLLGYRLKLLSPIVDFFVIVEADLTFSGQPKPLYFDLNHHLYDEYRDKIIHIIVRDMPKTGDAWGREAFQRNAIDRGLRQLPLDDKDVIIISDCDEIPDPTVLADLLSKGIDQMYLLIQDFYYYDITCKMNQYLNRVKIFDYGTYRRGGLTPQQARYLNGHREIQKAGWHLSYFGDAEFIIGKIRSFSHQELNIPRYTDPKAITDAIRKHKDLFGRFDAQITYIPINENPYPPPDYQMLL
jgi:beta-1,4-mannosyl-glycoprotein beta-1,4-N-acetylglucosaminyltransferase